MKICVASDSFKGSLDSFEVGRAIKEAAEAVYEDVCVTVCPIADGGEGSVSALCANGGTFKTVTVTGPAQKKVDAVYGISEDGKTAFIEAAASSGITLVSGSEKNPMHTTTYGLGELILDAIGCGIRNFIICIGGSATNDGGVGMLSALGYEFWDSVGNKIAPCAAGLEALSEISDKNADKRLSECTFHVACDVTNPLCGKFGCSRVFAPQKGADEDMIEKMDLWLSNYAAKTKKINEKADMNAPGAGAAGGLGFAFLSYLNASLESGIDLIITSSEIEKYISEADLVITGEGKLDGQSVMGKAPVGVAKIAKKYSKPVIALSGCTAPDASKCNSFGIDAFFSVICKPCTLDEAMEKNAAYDNVRRTAEQVFRVIKNVNPNM